MSDVQVALEQREVRQAFESVGDGPWTTLYESWEGRDGFRLLVVVLAPKKRRSDILLDHVHLPPLDFGAPGFVESYRSGRKQRKYLRFGGDEGYEPLVILQDHYPVRPRMLPQLSEEFRLYHNLWAS